jgi:hypothetical protein
VFRATSITPYDTSSTVRGFDRVPRPLPHRCHAYDGLSAIPPDLFDVPNYQVLFQLLQETWQGPTQRSGSLRMPGSEGQSRRTTRRGADHCCPVNALHLSQGRWPELEEAAQQLEAVVARSGEHATTSGWCRALTSYHPSKSLHSHAPTWSVPWEQGPADFSSAGAWYFPHVFQGFRCYDVAEESRPGFAEADGSPDLLGACCYPPVRSGS